MGLTRLLVPELLIRVESGQTSVDQGILKNTLHMLQASELEQQDPTTLNINCLPMLKQIRPLLEKAVVS